MSSDDLVYVLDEKDMSTLKRVMYRLYDAEKMTMDERRDLAKQLQDVTIDAVEMPHTNLFTTHQPAPSSGD